MWELVTIQEHTKFVNGPQAQCVMLMGQNLLSPPSHQRQGGKELISGEQSIKFLQQVIETIIKTIWS